MILELSFLACSLLAGQSCKDVHIPLRPEVSAMQCMLFGQQELAKWTIDNPNWSPSRGYTCAKVGTVANL
jgi:hypothetical protein